MESTGRDGEMDASHYNIQSQALRGGILTDEHHL